MQSPRECQSTGMGFPTEVGGLGDCHLSAANHRARYRSRRLARLKPILSRYRQHQGQAGNHSFYEG
jgi:hypothetical protein